MKSSCLFSPGGRHAQSSVILSEILGLVEQRWNMSLTKDSISRVVQTTPVIVLFTFGLDP